MWWAIGGLGIAGLGVGIYFFVKKRKNSNSTMSLLTTGVVGTSSRRRTPTKVTSGGKATAVVEPNWNAPFNMNYINDVKKWLGKPIKELPVSLAKKYALELKNAKGFLDDDEEAVKRVFKNLQDRTQVSTISRVFYFDHGKKDLWQHLRSFLSDSEMKKLIDVPVRGLPRYKLA